MRVRFGDYFWVIDDNGAEFERQGSEGHGHTVILIGVDDGIIFRWQLLAVPLKGAIANFMKTKSEFTKFGAHGGDAVGLFYTKTFKPCKSKRNV